MFSEGEIGFWIVSEFHLSIFFPKLAESIDILGRIGTLTILSLLSANMIFKKMDLGEGKEGRERKKERETDRHRETPTGCLLDAPEKKTEPVTWICALNEIKPITFQCTGWHSNELIHYWPGLPTRLWHFTKLIPMYAMFFDGIVFGDFLGFSM